MPNNIDSNPENPAPLTKDPTLGYVASPEFTTLRPSDFPNVDIPDPLKEDDLTARLRNLTAAEQANGELGHPTFPSSHIVTLGGGGHPNSIFAATVDGVPFFENFSPSITRSLTLVASDVSLALGRTFSYLKATPSSNAILVQSLKSTLTISAPPNPLPIVQARILLGGYVPKRNDLVTVVVGPYQVSVLMDGSESLPDVALNKILMALQSNGALKRQARFLPWFVGAYDQSYITMIANPGFTFTNLQIINRGQIQTQMTPQVSLSAPVTFTVL